MKRCEFFLLTKNNYRHPTYYNRLQAQCKYRLPFLSQQSKNKKTPILGVSLECRQTVDFGFIRSLFSRHDSNYFWWRLPQKLIFLQECHTSYKTQRAKNFEVSINLLLLSKVVYAKGQTFKISLLFSRIVTAVPKKVGKLNKLSLPTVCEILRRAFFIFKLVFELI